MGSKAELLKISRKADRIAPSSLLGASPLNPTFKMFFINSLNNAARKYGSIAE